MTPSGGETKHLGRQHLVIDPEGFLQLQPQRLLVLFAEEPERKEDNSVSLLGWLHLALRVTNSPNSRTPDLNEEKSKYIV